MPQHSPPFFSHVVHIWKMGLWEKIIDKLWNKCYFIHVSLRCLVKKLQALKMETIIFLERDGICQFWAFISICISCSTTLIRKIIVRFLQQFFSESTLSILSNVTKMSLLCFRWTQTSQGEEGAIDQGSKASDVGQGRPGHWGAAKRLELVWCDTSLVANWWKAGGLVIHNLIVFARCHWSEYMQPTMYL